jgi:hypothetical protein
MAVGAIAGDIQYGSGGSGVVEQDAGGDGGGAEVDHCGSSPVISEVGAVRTNGGSGSAGPVGASVPIPRPGTKVGAPNSIDGMGDGAGETCEQYDGEKRIGLVPHGFSWSKMEREGIDLTWRRSGGEEKVLRAASCKTGQF